MKKTKIAKSLEAKTKKRRHEGFVKTRFGDYHIKARPLHSARHPMKTNLKNLLVVILERLHTQAARVSYRFAFSKSDRRAIGILSGLIALTLFLRAHVPGKPAREWATSVEETAFLRPSALSGITDRPCEGQDGKRQKSDYVPPHYMVKSKGVKTNRPKSKNAKRAKTMC